MKRSAIVFVVGRMRIKMKMKMKMKMTMKMSFWRRCSQSVQDRFCGVAERQGQGGRVAHSLWGFVRAFVSFSLVLAS